MVLIFAMISSGCSEEPIPRRHGPNRNYSYDDLRPRQVTASASWPFRMSGAPCRPVDMGRTSTFRLDRLPQSHEGPRRIPKESRPMVALPLREHRRGGYEPIYRRYSRPSWFGCLCRVSIIRHRCCQYVACRTFQTRRGFVKRCSNPLHQNLIAPPWKNICSREDPRQAHRREPEACT